MPRIRQMKSWNDHVALTIDRRHGNIAAEPPAKFHSDEKL